MSRLQHISNDVEKAWAAVRVQAARSAESNLRRLGPRTQARTITKLPTDVTETFGENPVFKLILDPELCAKVVNLAAALFHSNDIAQFITHETRDALASAVNEQDRKHAVRNRHLGTKPIALLIEEDQKVQHVIDAVQNSQKIINTLWPEMLPAPLDKEFLQEGEYVAPPQDLNLMRSCLEAAMEVYLYE